MPDVLKQHAETVRAERKKEIEEVITALKETILENLDDKIEELKEISLD